MIRSYDKKLRSERIVKEQLKRTSRNSYLGDYWVPVEKVKLEKSAKNIKEPGIAVKSILDLFFLSVYSQDEGICFIIQILCQLVCLAVPFINVLFSHLLQLAVR